MGFVGVVPLGILAAIFHADWWNAGNLAIGLILTFSTRIFALYLATKVDERRARLSTVI
jgi:hypothetical protein